MTERENNPALLPARPGLVNCPAWPAGVHRLGNGRGGLLLVPPGYRAEAPAPLLVLLHGASGDASQLLPGFEAKLQQAGSLALMPDSSGSTWDVILGAWGKDVALLDAALARVFSEFAIDAGRIAVGGFSDGASYALSLGLANGGLFQAILAFSPGFAAPPAQVGRPRVFMSHGTEDTILPIDQCSRPLRKRLERAGYTVRYREFNGGHVVPPAAADEGLRWWLDGP